MNDVIKEKIVAMCEGNPGAISVLTQLALFPPIIDYLDEHGPKGSALWTLYKDTHGEDIYLTALDLTVRMEALATV